MDSDLFGRALSLQAPWRVEFDEAERGLNLALGFERGTRFGCPDCDRTDCTLHDVTETWRHLDFTPNTYELWPDEHGLLQGMPDPRRAQPAKDEMKGLLHDDEVLAIMPPPPNATSSSPSVSLGTPQ